MLIEIVNNRCLLEYLLRFISLRSVKNLCLTNSQVCKTVKKVMFRTGKPALGGSGTVKYWINVSKIESVSDVDAFHREHVWSVVLNGVNFHMHTLFPNLRNLFVMKVESPHHILKLPDTLKFLGMMKYSNPFPVLPKGLKYLYLSGNYKHPIYRDMMPEGLERIGINSKYPYPINFLPPNLKHLHISPGYREYEIDTKLLPRNISDLSLPFLSQHFVDYHNLPPYLEKLRISGVSEIPVGSLPPSLKELKIHKYLHEIKPGTLPDNLIALTIGYYPHDLKPGVLPSNLKYLFFREFKGKILPNSIPKSVTNLVTDWNNRSYNVIPLDVKYLEIKVKYYDEMDPSHFPKSIDKMSVNRIPRGSTIRKGQLPKVNFLSIHNNHMAIEPGALDNTECKTLKIIASNITASNITITESIIPSTVECIYIMSKKCQVDIKTFPPNMKTLIIPMNNTFKLPSLKGIQVKRFGKCYCQHH